jgi:hypothetical protein
MYRKCIRKEKCGHFNDYRCCIVCEEKESCYSVCDNAKNNVCLEEIENMKKTKKEKH